MVGNAYFRACCVNSAKGLIWISELHSGKVLISIPDNVSHGPFRNDQACALLSVHTRLKVTDVGILLHREPIAELCIMS